MRSSINLSLNGMYLCLLSAHLLFLTRSIRFQSDSHSSATSIGTPGIWHGSPLPALGEVNSVPTSSFQACYLILSLMNSAFIYLTKLGGLSVTLLIRKQLSMNIEYRIERICKHRYPTVQCRPKMRFSRTRKIFICLGLTRPETDRCFEPVIKTTRYGQASRSNWSEILG